MSTQGKATLTLIFFSTLWGMTWLPFKYLEEQGLNGLTINLGAYFFAFLITLPLAWSRHRDIDSQSWQTLLGTLIIGGSAMLCLNLALTYGDIIRVMALFYLLPFWGLIGGYLFLKEHITPTRIFAMLLSLVGAFTVLGGTTLFAANFDWTDYIALSSGLLFALNNILFRSSHQVPIILKLNAMFLGVVLISSSLTLALNIDLPHSNLNTQTWFVWGMLALIWMLIANLGTQWAVTQLESARSSIILILQLITATVSASFILSEPLTQLEILGLSLIICAAIIASYAKHTH